MMIMLEQRERKNQYNRQYKKINKERLKEYQKKYYELNKEFLKNKRMLYYYNNREKEKEHHKKYYQKNLEKSRETCKRWAINNKKRRFEYFHSVRYKEMRKKWRSENKELNNKLRRAWKKTEKGKIARNKYFAKRRRKMKWFQIFPNIFPKEILVDYHHIDGKWFVAPIPKYIHNKTNSGHDIKKHLEQTNSWIEFYYGMNPTDFLKEDCGVNIWKLNV